MTVNSSVEYVLRTLVVTAVTALVGLLWAMQSELHATDTHVTQVSDHVEALSASIVQYNLPQIQNDLVALKANNEWLQRQVDAANGGRRAPR